MYLIHSEQHTPKIDWLLPPASLTSLSRPHFTKFSTFSQLRVDQRIVSQLQSRLGLELPPPDWPHPCTSAKCKSVRKPHAILPDTPDNLTSASKYFQMLPDPPGAKQSALRLCKSILRCSWKYLKLWRCLQDAMRFNLQNSQILELLRPLRRSAEDFEGSWDCCAALQDTSRAAKMAA